MNSKKKLKKIQSVGSYSGFKPQPPAEGITKQNFRKADLSPY
jgi:hypothetical protein